MLEPLLHHGEKALGRVRTLLARSELARLREAHPLIGGAVTEAALGRSTLVERAWFRRIEALRAELLGSTEPLALVDYGAGARDLTLSAEEMSAGRQLTRTVREMCGASKSPRWAQMLFRLVRWLRPVHALELGTCLGLSGAYQAAGLALNDNAARLVSLEGAEALAAKARTHWARLGLDSRVEVVVGRFEDTLPATLERLRPLDHAFVDGHHDEKATLAYFEQLQPTLAPRALLLFDDITWNDGMARAWRTIAADPRVTVAVDLGKIGLTWFERGATSRGAFRIPLG